MLALFLIVANVLVIISWFKSSGKAWFFKWLLRISVLFCFVEIILVGVYFLSVKTYNEQVLNEYLVEAMELEQQKCYIRLKLFQGDLTEERINNFLESYLEMGNNLEYYDERIEECRDWMEFQSDIEYLIFLK